MRGWLLAAAVAAVMSALLFARPHATPGPPMRDFEAYYAAGMTWNTGADPYSRDIWISERTLPGVDARRYEALPFVSPPALLPVFGLLARVPFAAANILWRSVLIVALAALAVLTLKLAGKDVTPFSLLAIAVAVLGFGPLTSALALGQIALAAFACCTLAQFWQPAAALAWMQPNVALAQLAQLASKRAAVVLAAGLAVFAGMCVAVVGTAGIVHYAAQIHLHGAAERFSAIQLAPAAVAYGFGAPAELARGIGSAIMLAALSWWFILMRSLQDAIARFCATCALLPLAVPFFHEHDLLVLFVPAIVYATRAARYSSLAVFGAVLVATDWLGLAQRPDGAIQTLLLIGGFGAALTVLRERLDVRTFAIPALALAMIGAVWFAARMHPLPVWPDAMGVLPVHVDAKGIADTWEAQQRATGLFAPEPVWALLRLFSLIGCTLLAAAVALSSKSPADSRSPSPVPV